uniref:Uncharacterized protein n=1 Tax=Avena sativa TaxID=4498 RepID=A0ACD5UX77_AVESA
MSRPQARSYRRKAQHHGSKAHHGGGGGHGRPARWPARIMDGFRKMLVGLFAFPARPPTVTFSVDDLRGDAAAPNRSSCSANLQPVNNTHYDEAIADCVEFFNRSARVDVRSRPS